MSERRLNQRRSEKAEEDQRKIARFTENELNQSLKQISMWLKVLYVLTVIVAGFEVVWSVSKGLEYMTQGFFFGAVFIMLSILLWRAMFLIKAFLKNHSVSNLKRVHEQFNILFAYMAIVGVIFYIVTFLYRI
ncbi:MAG: hypothetical protein H6625_06135 [Bdellovibrionaceae bacterium]|nr:hypothetical protein [Pseudobdellovibrionaceae bacterium]